MWLGTIYNILISYKEWTLHEITKFKKLQTANKTFDWTSNFEVSREMPEMILTS